MTALVAGVDYSVEQIDVAIIPLDTDHGDPGLPDATLRQAAIPQARRELRCAHAAYLMQRLLEPVSGYDVAIVYIEEGYTQSMTTAKELGAILGGITAGAWRPRGVRDATRLEVNYWRGLLDLRGGPNVDRKAQSVTKALELYPDLPVWTSHHAAEALLIAHAGRMLCEQGAAA